MASVYNQKNMRKKKWRISDDFGLRKSRHSENVSAKKRYTLTPLYRSMRHHRKCFGDFQVRYNLEKNSRSFCTYMIFPAKFQLTISGREFEKKTWSAIRQKVGGSTAVVRKKIRIFSPGLIVARIGSGRAGSGQGGPTGPVKLRLPPDPIRLDS